MIGFFTDPYPDEILYSACARYHRRTRNPSKEATALDLFGNTRTKIVVDLQPRLSYLASQLPSTTYSISRLIDEYTMLPLYTPFMPGDRQEALRQDLCGEGGGTVHARLGILTSGIDVKNLRFCPACIDEDRALYGEPYWHRIHQAPGIVVCPTHAVFLSDSAVSIRNRSNERALVTAKQAISDLSPASKKIRQLDTKNREHNVLLHLAQDAAWVLGTQIHVSSYNVMRRRYLQLMLEQGLATYGGTVSHSRLKERLLEYYPSALLERLGCSLEFRYHWLLRLVNDWSRTRHPLHHLLLIQLLSDTAERFFKLSTEIEPFGKGPWPCLNVVCSHYRKLKITNCQIGHAQPSKKLMGIFQCECGFSYKRFGPDVTDERRYEYDRVVSFGNAWYEKLRGMLISGNYTRTEIAKVLGVTPSTVTGEIKRLKNITEPNSLPRERYERHYTNSASSDIDLRNVYREKWRNRTIEYPNASRSDHRRAIPTAYIWLVKHDKKWFEENSPKKRTSCGKRPRVNWSERDEKYSAEVRDMAFLMLTVSERPVWLSRTGIAKELGILTIFTKNAAKLPLTDKALNEVSENVISFAIRRILWASNCYQQEQISADKWRLQTRAAVSNKIARLPLVKMAFDKCVQALREMNETGWEDSSGGAQ